MSRGKHPCGLAGQVSQVDHVGVALLPGVTAVVFALGSGTAQLCKEAGILGSGGKGLLAEGFISLQQRRQLGKVGKGQGGLILGAYRLTAFVIGIADGNTQVVAFHGGIRSQLTQPTGIEPAIARLHFLRGHQILGEILENGCHIHGSHQTGVKAHQLQRRGCGIGRPHSVKGLVHFTQVQRIQTVDLIEGCAGNRAAAVIPEGDRHLVCGIVFIGKGQEIIQGLGIAHIGSLLLTHQLQALAAVHPALELGGIHQLILPHIGAAGLDNYLYIFGQLHFQHFLQVSGGKAAVCLQVTAAQIPVHCPAAVAQYIGRRCAASGCLRGAGVFGDVAAGSHRQAHGKGQKQRQQFVLHKSFLLLSVMKKADAAHRIRFFM